MLPNIAENLHEKKVLYPVFGYKKGDKIHYMTVSGGKNVAA